MSQQLTFDLGLRPALSRDDFLVTPSNAAAVALIDQWPDWPSYAAVLVGPPGAGKSHLAEVWRQSTSALLEQSENLIIERVPDLLSSGSLVVENLHLGTLPENALFHLLNFARQNGYSLLMTSAVWPLPFVKLPDLHSRLQALPVAAIKPPDDVLLRGVLVKLFSDRQIAVDEGLIGYLLTRMPRSLDMARMLVDRIDRVALEQGVEVSKVFVGRILAELENPDFL